IFRKIDGKLCEPIEHAIIDVGKEFTGVVIEKLSTRKGEMTNMQVGSDGYTRIEFHIPSRGLLGYRNEFITDTRGTGILNHSFYEYGPHRGEIPRRTKGALIAMENGISVAYALDKLQDRGVFFVEPGINVYAGMIIGAHNRETDLILNVTKTKKLTNIRAAGSDDAVKLPPARQFTLEQGLEYINEDELMEVTPETIRFRKKILEHNFRKSYKK
ncbi:translational GTPase TypA, partial [Elusimicrobiota bacterium]